MVRRSCLAGLLVVLALLFTFAGCSDNSTGNNKITGDPNSPEFQKMKAAIATSVDSTLSTMLRFGGDPGKASPQDTLHLRPDWGVLNPNDTLMYNYVNGWNIVYLGLTTGAEYNRVYVDSARFWLENDLVDQYFSYHVTQMDYIHHQTNTYKGAEDDYQNTATYLNVDYDAYSSTGGTLTGVGKFVLDDYYETTSGSTHDKYEFVVNLSAVAYSQPINQPWTSSYTTSGTLTMTATVTKDDVSNSWTMTATFSANGTAQITANTGNTEYQYQITPSIH
jgi:hypothetical protein